MHRWIVATVLVLALSGADDRSATPAWTPGPAADPAPQPALSGTADAIRAWLTDPGEGEDTGRRGAAWDDAHRLYRDRDYAPLWLDATCRVNKRAAETLWILNHALDDGLDPADYRASALTGVAAVLTPATCPPPAAQAAFDVDVSVNLLAYLHDLAHGRVDSAVGVGPTRRFDLPPLLRRAAADRTIGELVRALRPALTAYDEARRQLARYRMLEADPAFGRALPAEVVRPGDVVSGLLGVHQRLVAFGDAPPELPEPDIEAAYAEPLIAAVRRFQARHGLTADGILGRSTLAALHVPVRARIRQIELAMERLRGLSEPGEGRAIVVNIPMFQLWAWDAGALNGLPSFATRVIVGRDRSETPVIAADLKSLVFAPFWNVPGSIVRKEILPALARNPRYLEENDMEIVRGGGDDAQIVPVTAAALDWLRDGTVRLRQRPGQGNSLGLVKFVIPNPHDVYLHGTPTPWQFGLARRDLSHGCVRVQDPVALAAWLLRGQAGWDEAAIRAAMAGASSQALTLERPVRVLLFYSTAWAMPDGTMRFADDAYGLDDRLEAALR